MQPVEPVRYCSSYSSSSSCWNEKWSEIENDIKNRMVVANVAPTWRELQRKSKTSKNNRTIPKSSEQQRRRRSFFFIYWWIFFFDSTALPVWRISRRVDFRGSSITDGKKRRKIRRKRRKRRRRRKKTKWARGPVETFYWIIAETAKDVAISVGWLARPFFHFVVVVVVFNWFIFDYVIE